MSTSVPGIVVLGMHRSGTSAVAGSLVDAGLHTCLPADWLGATADNPSGHWESLGVNALNDRILAAVGHTWQTPPEAVGDWTIATAVRRHEGLARATFEWLHPDLPYVVKDPRMCLTLRFWLRVLPTPPAVVLVLRHPEAVARSLSSRDGIAGADALAMCERYMRAALAGCRGLRTLVVSYEEIVADPGAWQRQSLEFLARSGLDATATGRGSARSPVDPSLQHWKSPLPEASGGAPGEAWHAAMKLLGSHDQLPATEPA